jgi:hypothetical protein
VRKTKNNVEEREEEGKGGWIVIRRGVAAQKMEGKENGLVIYWDGQRDPKGLSSMGSRKLNTT